MHKILISLLQYVAFLMCFVTSCFAMFLNTDVERKERNAEVSELFGLEPVNLVD